MPITPRFSIPSELNNMILSRRVIPFIGAGFSTQLDMPNWEQLLSKLSCDIENSLPYEEVKKYCNGDLLQVAEYYFLLSDKNIGPIRHTISRLLAISKNPVLSPSHLELVNLGAPQIYTTNFDDLIEQPLEIWELQ